MKILLTNDDGFDAPGLASLAGVAAEFGECWIVAPLTPQSGIGHQITRGRPLELVPSTDHAMTLNGTPADCVRAALSVLNIEFDLVLSGINDGGNLGSDIFASGTAAAAREAALSGVRSIALSQRRLQFGESFDWTRSESAARRVITHLLAGDFPDRCWFNVNLPDSLDEVTPEPRIIDPCLLDTHPITGRFELGGDTEDLPWQLKPVGKYNDRCRELGRDVDVCFSGDIPITHHVMDGLTR